MNMLEQLRDLKVQDKNKVTAYLPVRNKGNEFEWDAVGGLVLSHSLGQAAAGLDMEKFKEECRKFFSDVCNDENLWPLLENTYFQNHALFGLDPRFSLLQAAGKESGKGAAANQRLGGIFREMLNGTTLEKSLADPPLNFVEGSLLKLLCGSLVHRDPPPTEEPYMPFLAKSFQEDIAFLAGEPRYLTSEFANFLRFYAFAYCSQMALNITEWKKTPIARPLYFILANEKASQERVHVKEHGYRLLESSLSHVFPLLAMSQALQGHKKAVVPRPFWRVYQNCLESAGELELAQALGDFLTAFIKKRELPPRTPANTIPELFEQLHSVALEQFNDPKSSREGINKKYVGQFDDSILRDFRQSRGRAGKVLILNHDQLILLTNLVVGKKERLWFSDLTDGFRRRGICFDEQSKMELVDFYERLGNVERKSDSGDAIYVKKTI